MLCALYWCKSNYRIECYVGLDRTFVSYLVIDTYFFVHIGFF